MANPADKKENVYAYACCFDYMADLSSPGLFDIQVPKNW